MLTCVWDGRGEAGTWHWIVEWFQVPRRAFISGWVLLTAFAVWSVGVTTPWSAVVAAGCLLLAVWEFRRYGWAGRPRRTFRRRT